ncbi:MAG TPA: substrate-binding domain-containing protein, partial [Pseudonocardiaceae bacterium]|nr:substrate-binding domain-containing protein [Pseudonocardiaceae bacterium]
MRGPRSRRDRLRPLGPDTLFAVVLLAASSLMLLRANEPIACETAVPLKIAAVPTIAPAIREITNRDVDAGCADIRVVAMTAAQAASMIAAGGPDQPALWIPDSALWPQRASQLAASSGVETPSVRPGRPLATSPLVVVIARAHAGRLGWPDRPVGWRDLVSGSVTGLSTTIGDPLSTTEGLTTLTAVRGLLGGAGTEPAVAGAMLQVGRDAVPSIRSAYERLGATADALAFTATEQTVVAHNRDGVEPPVVAVYPKDGTVALEYPLVRVVAPGE